MADENLANLAEYEGDIEVDDQLLEALIRVADLIVQKLQKLTEDLG